MERALKIFSALFATAAVVNFTCIAYFVVQVVLPEMARLQAHSRDAAMMGLLLGYGMMFVMVYALSARLFWRKERWNMAVLLAVAACFGFPIGPVLGLGALILLTRPAIRGQFAG